MTVVDEAKQEPFRFDFFAFMRRLERSYPARPRIGESATLRDEYVMLGQDPYMEFPASNLSKVEDGPAGRLRVLVKFLGLMGPQGAMPLSVTEESLHWLLARDDAFPRFLDLLNNRFLQLFFRTWADARPIAQHDRPKEDRFETYVGAMVGIGSPIYHAADSVPDPAKLAFAGLLGPQAKSASRLASAIKGLFNVNAEIDEFVGSHLVLEEGDRSRIGQRNSALGTDMMLGASFYTVQDKFRVRIFTGSMADYVRFLPTGEHCEPLADLVFFYIGEQLDWEIELALPAAAAQPTRLSQFGQLGWTTWIAPSWTNAEQAYRCDARFHPAEIQRQKRKRVA